MPYYEIGKTALPTGLFKALVVPRPIAWVSTISREGVSNLAPFSYFNIISENPPMVMLSMTNIVKDGGKKDTLINIAETKKFIINGAPFFLKEKMNLTSLELPHNDCEFKYAGVEFEPVKSGEIPRVKDSPFQLECELAQIIELPGTEKYKNIVMHAKVTGIVVDPRIIVNNQINLEKMDLVGRIGYEGYCRVNPNPLYTAFFSMKKPDLKEVKESKIKEEQSVLLQSRL